MKSPRYISQILYINLANTTIDTILWKYAGAPFSPIGTRSYSYISANVMKVVKCREDSASGT